MDMAEYAANITFRFLPPETNRPRGFRAINRICQSLGFQLEAWNTRLPEDQPAMQRRLDSVCRVPRMSTFAIGALINRGVSQLPADQAYLNIGVWHGFTFFAGMAENPDKLCIAVDNFSHKNSPRKRFLKRFENFRGPRHSFHEGDFRAYLSDVHQAPLGFYLFDGPHSYQDQLDGLLLAEQFFADGCLVLVDDTNWPQVRQANLDFIAQSRHEYCMLLDVRTPKSGHPSFWNGVMLFQKVRRVKSAAA